MREYRQDLTGRRFAAWKVVRLAERGSKGHNPMWVCRCQCGTEKVVRGDSLKRGQSRSCGCHAGEWA